MQRRKKNNLISLTPGFSQVWSDSAAAETVLTVSNFLRHVFTSLKRGVNKNSIWVFAPSRLCVKTEMTNA